MTTELAPIEWEVDIPLVTNPMIIGAWLKAMGATYLLSILIVGTVFTGTGKGADFLRRLAEQNDGVFVQR